MNIRLATENDREIWDSYVQSHPLGSPYHRWAWKRAMEDGYGLDTRYWIAIAQTGDVAGVAPSAIVPSILGRGRPYALPYCDRGEPIAKNSETRERLLSAMLATEKRPIEIRATTDDDKPVDIESLHHGQKVRLLLQLPTDSESLLAGFKSKHRSQINKAKKNNLTTELGNSPKLIEDFYRVFTTNMRDLGSPTHAKRWFLAISNHFASDCKIGTIIYQDKVIAAGIVLQSGDLACIPWASTLREFNKLAPNMLLYWTLLESTSNDGFARFDFGRSSYGEGTYKFKTQWGARPVPLDWRTLSAVEELRSERQWHESSLSASGPRRLAEAVWKRLPLSLSVRLGSIIRPRVSL